MCLQAQPLITILLLKLALNLNINSECQAPVASRQKSATACLGGPKLLAVIAPLIVLCFGRPLWDLVRYSWHSELYSYILLVPLISLYLFWSNRPRSVIQTHPSRGLSLVPMSLGIAVLVGYGLAVASGWNPALEDYLCLMMLALIALVSAAVLFCLGLESLRSNCFAFGMLLFLVPLPDVLIKPLVIFLQHWSANVAAALFSLSGTPFLRNDTFFQLPGMQLEVAPECSGIHSTMVLFITSLIAGYMFLHSRWRRALLALSIVPLALLRNGFRVFVIGQLCVWIGPEMIDSPIHRKGGPLFFLLSLVPFFLFLFWLRRAEHRKSSAPNDHSLDPHAALGFSKPTI